jgi:hypothetical protein
MSPVPSFCCSCVLRIEPQALRGETSALPLCYIPRPTITSIICELQIKNQRERGPTACLKLFSQNLTPSCLVLASLYHIVSQDKILDYESHWCSPSSGIHVEFWGISQSAKIKYLTYSDSQPLANPISSNYKYRYDGYWHRYSGVGQTLPVGLWLSSDSIVYMAIYT